MIAAIYARKSNDDVWGAVVAAWRWVDWTAVASLATLAAVLVALVPIFVSWKRDRTMRRLVRAQVLTHLRALRRPLEAHVSTQSNVLGHMRDEQGPPRSVTDIRPLLGERGSVGVGRRGQ